MLEWLRPLCLGKVICCGRFERRWSWLNCCFPGVVEYRRMGVERKVADIEEDICC